MKKIFFLPALIIILVNSSGVYALSQSQTDVFNLGIRYFNTEESNSNDYGANSCTSSGTLPGFIPEPYNGAFTAGAGAHNVAPELIAALFTEENFTGIDPSKIPGRWSVFITQHTDPDSGWAVSSAGATGPFQFLPSTWTGLGYNIADINKLSVAADAAAKYAETNGATLDQPVSSWSKFIYSYNHAQWYVDAVMSYYQFYVKSDSGSSTATTTSSCGTTGISPDGFVFPQVTTKTKLQQAGWNPNCTDPISEMGPNPPTTDPALYANINGLCHHNYLASDIFNSTGTPVVAVRPGRIVSAHDGGTDDNGCPFGMTVRLYSDKSLGGDGLWYYYAHMLRPSEGGGLKVTEGQTVKAGDQLGVVGTDKDAECTQSHTHFDVSPVDNGFHRGFDGTAGPLLDPMPALKAAYQGLKDR